MRIISKNENSNANELLQIIKSLKWVIYCFIKPVCRGHNLEKHVTGIGLSERFFLLQISRLEHLRQMPMKQKTI